MSEKNTLTNEIAEKFLNDESSVDISLFTEIEDKAAATLASHEVDLPLNGIVEISDGVAESLSQHKGVLILNGLKELSDSAAESLSNHQDAGLLLIGLEKLSDEGAKSLAKLNRPRNEHDFSTGLVISDLLEEKVQNYRNGMEKAFTKDQVEAFIENPWGDIETDEFTLIEDDAAKAFEGFDDSLNLPGLLELSDAAADSLSKITGGLTLSGVTKLSDSASG